MCSNGLGVSILPASFLPIKIDSGRYLALQEPDAKTEVWLVTNRQRALSAPAQRMIGLMLQQQ
ncbi:MAG: LysR substrate-binding domain-containing protein [Sodalis sp. (in: enterobacteria)]|uniref:LysR substrate-binding domain-containing protein n=1 Tax=Sodalis sp. (in: enterobacteria) TaxID=1898979 RepID=UPI003F40DCCB